MAKRDCSKITVEVRTSVMKKFKELAGEAGLSQNAMFERLVLEKYSEDAVDENLLLARMGVVEKKLSLVNEKSETFFKLAYYIMPYMLACMADLPKDKEQARFALDNGAARMKRLVTKFRAEEKQNDIGFVESVFGTSQETLREEQSNKRER